MKAKLCFFDDNYLAARPGVTRRFFHPERLGGFEDPDASLQTYTSFFFDPLVKKFRLYYEIPDPKFGGTEIRKLMLAEGERVEDFLTGRATRRPVEGLCAHGVHGCGVTLNEAEGRYLLTGNFHADDRQERRMVVAVSADGVHFDGMRPIWSDYSDTYNSVYYNPDRKEYGMTCRAALMDRRIFLRRSPDGERWDDPALILHPTGAEGAGVQYYAMGVSHGDGLFYGLLWRFVTDPGRPDFTDMSGTMENDLYYSYDGVYFMPTGLSPVCDRPLPPAYGSKQMWLLNLCEDGAGRHILCGGGAGISHGSSYGPDKFCSTLFYGIRKDGFCALEGTGKNSVVYTKPFLIEDGALLANFDARGGRLEAAVLDGKGEPIEGFGFEDCDGFAGEEAVAGTVRWQGAELGSLAGRTVRLALRLNGALLYTLTFEGRPCLRRPQISLNDPRPL